MLCGYVAELELFASTSGSLRLLAGRPFFFCLHFKKERP